ncbi:MAG TPA: beta-N-acetylhexosaminidase, partial [Phaeodactylibacter sp.]|nr:beta-N-acetylhexosaminidase [Phaeodactylibacter sp.]
LFLFAFSSAQNGREENVLSATTSILQKEIDWVNQTFESLSPDERLGQLFMIRAHSDKGPEHIAKVKKLISDYHVGGLCFFQGTPEKQARLTNTYQALSKKVPLMIAMDAEWGLGMRLKKNTISFPKQLTLGAIQDNRLIYDMGREVARQCRRLGVHINFAPVADVNNNPENPVINTRSFGEDRYNVTVKSYMYMKGMQDGGLMACAKHFPGHGDTDTDSHYDLPVIAHPMSRLDSIELFPFKVLAEHGIQSMMVAHLQVPAIDHRKNLPTTLSDKAVNGLLKNKLHFKGLIFTDGLGMKGVTKHHKKGEVEAKALLAGNDVLLLPQDVPAAFAAIKRYLKEGKLSQKQVDDSVKKILRAKYQLGLTQPQRIELEGLNEELNTAKAISLKKTLIENALTLVRDDEYLVPFQNVKNKNVVSLALGANKKTAFQKMLSKFGVVKAFQTPKDISKSKINSFVKQYGNADNIIVISLHDMSSYANKKFGISKSQKELIAALQKKTKVVLVVFGSPYALKYFDDTRTLLVAYEEDGLNQEAAAQALFGVFAIQGHLPVEASPKSEYNAGLNRPAIFRLGYDTPERVGLDGDVLEKGIDSLVQIAIEIEATPGAVVLVAKDGKIVFNKAYGYHTYRKKKRMTTSDIFDVASITKIAATTLAVMKLHEEGQISIYEPISKYLPELKGTNKASMTIKDIMTHRAGLIPWIPFYEQTLSNKGRKHKPSPKYYRKKQTGDFSVPVTEKLFLKKDFVNDIKKQIRESELRSRRDYKYSDLGFYMLADMVQCITGIRINDYVTKYFYAPLGLKHTGYLPTKKFSPSFIVPTEEDKYFRYQRIHGTVHDMGAAMLGGVSGHAGLFSTAEDLAVIMQMLLNDGYYAGRRFLQASTVKAFTMRPEHCTRRAIGFDMKELDKHKSQNMCSEASDNTFGHLGFTGIGLWADPDNDL